MLKSLAMVVLGLLLGIVGSDVDSALSASASVLRAGRRIGFVIIAVGCLRGEIISNLSEPEERVVFTRSGEPLSDAEGHETSRRPILRGTALGHFSAFFPAPRRRSPRLRRT